MSVLSAYFNHSVDQNVKPTEDYILVKKATDDGGTNTIFEKVDKAAIVKSNGSAKNWSIKEMTKAGINIQSLTPHTGNTTRMEGIDTLNSVLDDVNAFTAETIQNNKE